VNEGVFFSAPVVRAYSVLFFNVSPFPVIQAERLAGLLQCAVGYTAGGCLRCSARCAVNSSIAAPPSGEQKPQLQRTVEGPSIGCVKAGLSHKTQQGSARQPLGCPRKAALSGVAIITAPRS